MWQNVGIYRSGASLLDACKLLNKWAHQVEPPGDLAALELNNMVLLGQLMAKAALLRKESRGAHYRTDYPNISDDWGIHITMEARNNASKLPTKPTMIG